MARVLVEAEPGIHHQRVAAKTGRLRAPGGDVPLAEHVGDDVPVGVVRVDAEAAHRDLRTPRVHEDVGRVMARSDLCQLRVSAAGDVVHAARTGGEAGVGDGGVGGVDGHAGERRCVAHHREHAIELRRGVDARCPGPGRLAAHVDHVGAGSDERVHAGTGALRPEELAAVAERVRSDVADAHHEHAARLVQPLEERRSPAHAARTPSSGL